jgi:hypothetical protein
MKNTIYKIGFLLLLFVIGISCESPEAETNYTPASYEFPSGITLGSSNIKSTSFDFTYTISGEGKGYYVVVKDGGAAPTSNAVYNGTAAGYLKKGSFDLTGAPVTISVGDLCNNTAYAVYAVQMTADNFLSPSPVKVSATTSGKSIAGTYTANPSAFGEAATEYTATLTLVAGTSNQYTIDSAWGPNFIAWVTGDAGYEGLYIYSGVLTINTDNTVTIVGDNSWSAVGGAGSFDDSCLNEFSYTLKQTLFGNPFTTDVVLTQVQ